MTKTALQVEEIKSVITLLPQSELADLGERFRELEAQIWDAQVEDDVRAGQLDKLAQEVGF